MLDGWAACLLTTGVLTDLDRSGGFPKPNLAFVEVTQLNGSPVTYIHSTVPFNSNIPFASKRLRGDCVRLSRLCLDVDELRPASSPPDAAPGGEEGEEDELAHQYTDQPAFHGQSPLEKY